jgi:sugar/nucleoside kinase (ribokinase family)
MPENYVAVVAGHICLDVIPELFDNTPESLEMMSIPGRLVEIGPATCSTGGPVSNTGLALHKLGIETRLMGKVGNDLFGQAVRQIVSGYGPRLADGMVVDQAVTTSYTVVISPPGRDRILLHCPGANDTFSAGDVRYDVVAGARLFHFGYPPLMKLMFSGDKGQLPGIFGRVKELGVTTSLDMALPDPTSAAGRADWPGILKATLPYVDIFAPSIEEILYMMRRDTYNRLYRMMGQPDFLPLITPELLSDLSQELLELGPKIVGLKLGERGFYIRTAGPAAINLMGGACPADPAAWAHKELWAPCFKVNVAGTAGAGDATIAGLLSGLLRGLPPEAALTAAVASGACNVEAVDTLSGLRGWEEIMARIRSGWPRYVMLPVEAPGWRFDDSQQLWIGPG